MPNRGRGHLRDCEETPSFKPSEEEREVDSEGMVYGGIRGGALLPLAFQGKLPDLSSVTRLVGIGPQSPEETVGGGI